MRTSTSCLILLGWLTLSVSAQGGGPDPLFQSCKTAHAVLGSVAWVFFFPLGSILLRVLSGRVSVLAHIGIQAFTLTLVVANAGLGIWMGLNQQELNNAHPIIGLLTFSVVWFQAAGGLIHHLMWRKQHKPTVVGYAHIWLGRSMITLGMINGGLGLQLSADAERGEYIAYGVIAGVIWVVWMGVDVWATFVKPKPKREPKKLSEASSDEETKK